MSEFQIGEIAIFVIKEDQTLYLHGMSGDGTECELRRYVLDREDGSGWFCHFKGDPSPHATGLWWVSETNLRKKKPPLSSWEDVEEKTNWNPVKETTFINE